MRSKMWIVAAIAVIAALGTLAAVIMTPATDASGVLQQSEQTNYSVSGKIVSGQGIGMADKPVTLHLMGCNDSGAWEICQLTTATGGEAPDAGKFVFEDVIVTPDTGYAYISSYTTLSSGTTIYGMSNNFTLKGDVNAGFIVLPDPQDIKPSPL